MSSVMTRVVARLLLPTVILIALAVLVKGYVDVGDGFSAGVIVALGILLQYLAFGPAAAERMLPIRIVPALAFVGLLLALVVAAIPLLRGDALFTHLPPPGEEVLEIGTLEVITAVAFDLSVFLLVVGAVTGIIHNLAMVATEERSKVREP